MLQGTECFFGDGKTSDSFPLKCSVLFLQTQFMLPISYSLNLPLEGMRTILLERCLRGLLSLDGDVLLGEVFILSSCYLSGEVGIYVFMFLLILILFWGGTWNFYIESIFWSWEALGWKSVELCSSFSWQEYEKMVFLQFQSSPSEMQEEKWQLIFIQFINKVVNRNSIIILIQAQQGEQGYSQLFFPQTKVLGKLQSQY